MGGARRTDAHGIGLGAPLATRAPRIHVDAGRADARTSRFELEFVLGVEIHLHDLGRVQSEVARVCVDHVAGIAARRHARQIGVLDALEDIGADADATRDGDQILPRALARIAQDRAESKVVSHVGPLL